MIAIGAFFGPVVAAVAITINILNGVRGRATRADVQSVKTTVERVEEKVNGNTHRLIDAVQNIDPHVAAVARSMAEAKSVSSFPSEGLDGK